MRGGRRGWGRGERGERRAYVFCFGVALEIGLDGLVLLVELGEVWDEIFDDVGVGEGVDAGFVGCVCGDATCTRGPSASGAHGCTLVRTYIGMPAC